MTNASYLMSHDWEYVIYANVPWFKNWDLKNYLKIQKLQNLKIDLQLPITGYFSISLALIHPLGALAQRKHRQHHDVHRHNVR